MTGQGCSRRGGDSGHVGLWAREVGAAGPTLLQARGDEEGELSGLDAPGAQLEATGQSAS